MYLAVLIVLVAALAAATGILAVRRQRAGEAAALAKRIAEAMLRDGRFIECALATTVRLPFWRGKPPTIALSGEAVGPELRQLARRIVVEEISSVYVRIEHWSTRRAA